MTWTSSVPAVLTALVDGLTAAMTGVTVVDGYVVSGSPVKEALLIGAAPEDEPAVLDQEIQPVGIRGGQSHETYTIRCEARALNTAKNLPAARTRVYALLSQVGAFLAADPTLGRTVNSAHLGTVSLAASQDKGGALAALAFGIDIDAFIS